MDAASPMATTNEHPRPSDQLRFPPSPAATAKESRDSSTDEEFDLTGPACLVDGPGVGGGRSYPLPPRSRENKVLPEDLKTPDNHVPRDPRLIRLTGVHPFNVEAPLSDLFNEGFLTTKDLHYVRNHGPVPLVEDASVLDWEFSIEGMVQYPVKMTLRDLLKDYEQVTYPVTLVCAGNRRKEQNVVRKTKGFSWGAAGLSTALWTGVTLPELLTRAAPKRGAKYVCFEGADKLPNGYYGTGIKLNWAMDPNRGVLVAHRMNGEPLPPDHGKPLRIIIPGQIGGRSVKWLKRIIVTAQPSDNWYHIYDNRVLPTMIEPDASANLPETWKDERYAIYDLNTNSATVYPAHGEKVALAGDMNTYKLRGYAYSGGGRRVTRVEVTLDKGKSWTLAHVSYPEDKYRLAPDGEMLYGGRVDMSWRETSFCWCFWELDVPISQLRDTDDVMVRAMDEAMMVQPRDMYWSVLGMMNNPWYRVVIHKEGHELRFEHPTQPALLPGGWMERVKKAGGVLTNGYWGERAPGEEASGTVEEEPVKEICMVNKDVKKEISMNEVKKHDSEAQPWFVVNGEVYDGTKFLAGHPGGAASIIGAAGQDISEEFLAIHSENAKAMMPDYHIGTLDEASKAQLTEGELVVENDSPREIFLQAKQWSKAILSEKKKISADTKVFTFTLDHEAQAVGLPVGQHLMMRLRDPVSREAIIRAYTPISEGTDRGKLNVLIKIYYDAPDRKGGRMTQALDSIPIGHFVDFKGPVGKFEYLGRGRCSVSGHERRVRRFVMVCAGSGVTPIFQVLRAVMKDPEDPTFCLVLDGNRVEEDILCKEELDAMIANNGHRCRLLYTLTRPQASWTGLKGRMDRGLFEREVGAPKKDDGSDEGGDMVLICGPESMEKSVHSIFTGMGWAEDDLLFF
ncbi:Nitrate reductase [Pleurostoma richardsiae]|uniref:Nitrate reductase n=1 Tax=Pleurostoma richardsiae TaxID=41990 RepID=A0AA38RAZ8_9PEZI|nr:Nitrate reductase [Pleurostoma richardsiae]